MATKTISITEEAYARLFAEKEDGESFSNVITKKFGKHSLRELIGVLSHDEAKKIREHIAERRKAARNRLEIITERLA